MYPKFKHPSAWQIIGPSGSGKSYFLCNLLHCLHLFDTEINKIHWYNTEIKALPLRENLPSHLDIKYFDKLPEKFENEYGEPLIVIIDDMMTEAAGSEAISHLYTKKSHHEGITCFYLTQNVFHKSKYSRDISLNCGYLVLFKTIRGKAQLNKLFQQMYPESWRQLQKIYKDVTRKPYTYLLMDLTPTTPDLLRFRTDIFNKQTTCFCPKELLNEENGAVAETVKGEQIFPLRST